MREEISDEALIAAHEQLKTDSEGTPVGEWIQGILFEDEGE